MAKHVIAETRDLEEGDRIVKEVAGIEIAVFKIDGGYHATVNYCPHQNGPLCEGTLGGTFDVSFDRETLETETNWHREGSILSCPWHNWQFDVTTGKSLYRDDIKIPTYSVEVEGGEVIIDINK